VNARQFIKLATIIGASYWACHGALYVLNGPIAAIIEDMLTVSLILIPLVSAMSFGMFTYVDNMAKELTDLRNEVNREKYLFAQEGIAALKKEVLLNAGLVIALCFMERAAKSIAGYFLASALTKQDWLLTTIFISLRFAFFAAAMWATISQLKGFVTAVEYRTLISSNRK
jgi:hypothetical protein